MILKSKELKDTLDYYLERAKNIHGFTKMKKNDLINLYIEHEGTDLGDYYLSAVIVRYWHLIFKAYKLVPAFPPEDYYMVVVDGIIKAISDRSWLNPSKKIYGDPNGPDKCVQRCVKTKIYNYLKINNFKKRSQEVSNVSLNNFLNDNGLSFLDTLGYYDQPKIDICSDLVQHYIDQGNLFNAVAVDAICFQNDDGKNSIQRAIRLMLSMDNYYTNYFISTYERVSDKELSELKSYVKSLVDKTPSGKHYVVSKKIKNLLKSLRSNKEFVESLEV